MTRRRGWLAHFVPTLAMVGLLWWWKVHSGITIAPMLMLVAAYNMIVWVAWECIDTHRRMNRPTHMAQRTRSELQQLADMGRWAEQELERRA